MKTPEKRFGGLLPQPPRRLQPSAGQGTMQHPPLPSCRVQAAQPTNRTTDILRAVREASQVNGVVQSSAGWRGVYGTGWGGVGVVGAFGDLCKGGNAEEWEALARSPQWHGCLPALRLHLPRAGHAPASAARGTAAAGG